MLNVLYMIIIYPVQLIIECIYTILSASVFKENIGLSLGGLSFAVNILCLPLYAKAERLQQLERDIQKKMAARIAGIKKNFKNDEQHMILSMYYRENHYHPIMALRSSLSLLMQIPFFIAAYSFLSHLESIRGKPLFFIQDLSAPDTLFSIAGFSINVLPLVMTTINIIAGLVYSGGFPAKEKIQLYAMSLFFLILLYNSPAALVLYWTMNNLFSLVKNILFKTKDPRRVIYLIGCFIFASFMIYVLFFRYNEPRRAFRNKAFTAALFFLFACIPLYLKGINYIMKTRLNLLFASLQDKKHLFVLACVNIWLLIGCYIPVTLVASDPVQFASVDIHSNAFSVLFYPAVQGLGLLFFWPLYIFLIFSKKVKGFLVFFFTGLAFCAFINFFIFHGNYGTISQTLAFKIPSNVYLAGGILNQLLNIFVCIAVIAVTGLIVFLKKVKWLPVLQSVCIAGMTAVCLFNLVQIRTDMLHNAGLRGKISESKTMSESDDFTPVFTLSKTGKNVFIIMLDGAVNSYFSLFIEKEPQYRDSFNGFTYYPNTATFFRSTLFSTPALFGGYEYTTYNMDKRFDKKLKAKHNEAMLLLPELFKQQDFDVTVANMPYINYEGIMDPRFYEEWGIRAENISGLYNKKYIHEVLGLDEYTPSLQIDKLLQRNMLIFSVFQTSVYSLRDFIYQNGKYWSSVDYSLDSGIPEGTLGSYTALYYLPQITIVDDGGMGTLSLMVNDLTHDPVFLQYPGYTVEARITDTGEDFFRHTRSFKDYHVNAASYILLSKWFSYLKENEVWNNTRIIIVSDHGDYGITHPDFSSFQNIHTLQYNPILLFKDFNAEGDIHMVDDFMTNADTPFLALKDIAENAKNPFTGNMLRQEKKDGVYIFTEGHTNPGGYTGNTCLEDSSKFFHVRDSVFNSANWRELRYKEFRDNQ